MSSDEPLVDLRSRRRGRLSSLAGRAAFADEALGFIDHLYGAARRLTGDPARAEDLVQDTYVKAFRFAQRFQDGTNLKAWLLTILHNTFRNDRRGEARDPVHVDSPVVEREVTRRAAGVEDPEEALLRATLTAELQLALDDLPAAYREAVWLRDVEELTYQEIADVLRVPIGTVMSRISRGRRELHRRLASRRRAVSAP